MLKRGQSAEPSLAANAPQKVRSGHSLASQPYGPYSSVMTKNRYGAEEARTLLPELLERAHRGNSSVITKRGKPYAEIVPVGTTSEGKKMSLLVLAGSGRGLWGKSSRRTVKRLRDEWR